MARSDLMKVMDEMRDWAAVVTGLKTQLIEQGWSERAAEMMTYAFVTMAQSRPPQ